MVSGIVVYLNVTATLLLEQPTSNIQHILRAVPYRTVPCPYPVLSPFK